MVVTTDLRQAREAVMALTRSEGVDHAVDVTGNPELLGFARDVMRLGGKTGDLR